MLQWQMCGCIVCRCGSRIVIRQGSPLIKDDLALVRGLPWHCGDVHTNIWRWRCFAQHALLNWWAQTCRCHVTELCVDSMLGGHLA
jgi:hypothetical protein